MSRLPAEDLYTGHGGMPRLGVLHGCVGVLAGSAIQTIFVARWSLGGQEAHPHGGVAKVNHWSAYIYLLCETSRRRKVKAIYGCLLRL